MMLAVGRALVFPYTFMPILNTPNANQDVWIVLLLAFVYILIFNAPILFLINKFKGLTVNQIVETIVGKIVGKAALMMFVLFFIYCYIACSLITTHFMNSYLFTATPRWALLLFLVLPVCFASYRGAGTIGRLSVFIVPFVMFTILFFLVFGINRMDFSVLRPILTDSTFINLNISAFLTAARFSEILIFLVFSFYLGKKASVNKTYAVALVVFGVFYMLILMPTILVLGVDFAKISWNPYYVYTRQVNALSFLERLQAFNTLAWFPASVLKLAIYNFMASRVLSLMFKAKSHKKFVVPLAAIGYIACIVPFMSNSGTIKLLSSDRVFPWVILPVIFVLPCLLVAVYFIRRKKLKPMIKKAQSRSSEISE
jgi:spore germination protein KB